MMKPGKDFITNNHRDHFYQTNFSKLSGTFQGRRLWKSVNAIFNNC